jgi:FAD/FMN-containing dehydrogenase
VPISHLADFVSTALARLKAAIPDAVALAYGHVGDGNVHLNVIPPMGLTDEGMHALFLAAENTIFEIVDGLGGSISAEHGIGRVKRHAFLKRADKAALEIAISLKNALDPMHILSMGRILPDDATSE